MQKYLVSSKKSSTFASAFAQKTGFAENSDSHTGSPNNFNFWGKRRTKRSAIERRGRESHEF